MPARVPGSRQWMNPSRRHFDASRSLSDPAAAAVSGNVLSEDHRPQASTSVAAPAHDMPGPRLDAPVARSLPLAPASLPARESARKTRFRRGPETGVTITKGSQKVCRTQRPELLTRLQAVSVDGRFELENGGGSGIRTHGRANALQRFSSLTSTVLDCPLSCLTRSPVLRSQFVGPVARGSLPSRVFLIGTKEGANPV